MRALICALFFYISIINASANIIDYQYYPIWGKNFDDLMQEIENKNPQGFHAYTTWYIRWHWQKSRNTNGCALRKIQVALTSKIIFPKWMNPEEGSDALKSEWLRYTDALMNHELGHIQHGINAKNEIYHALHSLGTSTSCIYLSDIANSTAQKIIMKYKQKDILFDRYTNHGQNTGAVFRRAKRRM